MNEQTLHPINEWEDKRPNCVTFDQVLFTEKSRMVRLVKGSISIQRKRTINGQKTYESTTRKAHWDGYGYCYVGTHNLRNRDYDIPFNC